MTRIVNQFLPSQAKQITADCLSHPKDSKDYQNRIVHENEEAPIDFKIPNEFQPTMVTVDDALKRDRKEKN